METKIIVTIAVFVVLTAIIVWRNWPRKKEQKEEKEDDEKKQ